MDLAERRRGASINPPWVWRQHQSDLHEMFRTRHDVAKPDLRGQSFAAQILALRTAKIRLADVYMQQGRFPQALCIYRAVLKALISLRGAMDLDVASMQIKCGVVLEKQADRHGTRTAPQHKDLSEALRMYRSALAVRLRLGTTDEVLSARAHVEVVCRKQGKQNLALKMCDDILKTRSVS